VVASYQWHRESQAYAFPPNGNGADNSETFLISPGSSVQRVVYRLDAHARFWFNFENAETGAVASAGMRVEVNDITTPGSPINIWSGTHFMRLMGWTRPSLPDQYFVQCEWTMDPFDVDVNYRRAAPPPPAEALTLDFHWYFTLDPPASAEVVFKPDWLRVDSDAAYLTSTADVTAP